MRVHLSQRLFQLSLAALFLAPFVGFLWLSSLPPSMAESAFPVEPTTDPGGLSVRWLGGGSVHVSDGETAFLTDPFFSRPSLGKVIFDDIGPAPIRIEHALSTAGISQLDAVIPLHSHYDHMLDAPWVAEHFDALLVGSRSSANGARGSGLPEALIREVEPGQSLHLGRFELTFIRAAHAPMAPFLEELVGHRQSIRHPFSMPARFTAWREGEVLALMVRHPQGSLMLHSTAGFRPGMFAEFAPVDLALVSTAMLSRQSPEFRRKWFHEVVSPLQPASVVPIHWDNPFRQLSATPEPIPYFLDNISASLQSLHDRGKQAGITIRVRQPMDRIGLTPKPSGLQASQASPEPALGEG